MTGALRNRRTNKNAAGLEVLAALNSTLAPSCPLPIGTRVNLRPSCLHTRGNARRCQASQPGRVPISAGTAPTFDQAALTSIILGVAARGAGAPAPRKPFPCDAPTRAG